MGRAGLSERMRGDKQGSMTIGSHVVMFNESAEPTLKETLTYEPHKYREEVKFRGEKMEEQLSKGTQAIRTIPSFSYFPEPNGDGMKGGPRKKELSEEGLVRKVGPAATELEGL